MNSPASSSGLIAEIRDPLARGAIQTLTDCLAN